MNLAEILEKWKDHGGESRIRDLGDGTWIKAQRLMFHWMLIRGDENGDLGNYFDRWCYETEKLVMDALQRFPERPPAGYEPSGWHRHPPTHRRRPEGSPEKEYIES